LNLACWITSIRFILAPFIFWQLSTHSNQGIIGTLILLFLAGSTDVLDGWVARARNEISELGKALDPLADKLVILGTLAGLTWWGLPVWMVLVYLVKESLQVIAGVFLLRKVKQLIPSNRWGKSSTFFFFLGFGVFFLHHLTGEILIGLAILLAIYALFTYYRAFVKLKSIK
jgi:Phosphatidylglycerophosphate synthase